MNDVKSTNEKKDTFNGDKNIVTLRCNRYGGHDINLGKLKKTIVFRGEIDLDMSKPEELRVLMTLLKQINVRGGVRNSYTEIEGSQGARRTKVINIWEITKNEQLIPVNLRKIKHRPGSIILDNEQAEINKICPGYENFIAKKTKLDIMKKILKA